MRAAFVHMGGKKLGFREEITRLPVKIGRSSSNDLILPSEDTRSSSRHAELSYDGTSFILKDLGSTNGTFVNDQQVTSAIVKHGDIIQFGMGGPKLIFEVDKVAAGDIPESMPAIRGHGKEFGRETVQMMISRAVDRSSRPWKIAVLLSLVVLFFVTTVSLLLVYIFRSTSPNPAPQVPATSPMPLAEIAERNRYSVVLVYNKFHLYDRNGRFLQEQISNGSGFIASKSGEIITNRHVIEPWRFNAPNLHGGKTLPEGVTGKIKNLGVFFVDDILDESKMQKVVDYTVSDEADVARLVIQTTRELTPVHGVDDRIENLRQGDEIAVIAFPLGLELNQMTEDKLAKSSLTRGIISKIPDNHKQIQLDVAAYEGSSGGPIFNSKGEVIGLLTSGPNDTLNFGTPIRYAKKLLQKSL